MGTTLIKNELRKLIRDEITGVVNKRVDESLAPLKEQSTNWMEQLRGAGAENVGRMSAPYIKSPEGEDSPFGRAVKCLIHGGGKQDASYQDCGTAPRTRDKPCEAPWH